MSALRYCGAMRVRITLLPDDSYRCCVTDGEQRHTVIVNAARVLLNDGIGLDNPRAFDEVADSALAFALYDEEDPGDLHDLCEHLDVGPIQGKRIIARAPTKRWLTFQSQRELARAYDPATPFGGRSRAR